jgi:hypothetical protein
VSEISRVRRHRLHGLVPRRAACTWNSPATAPDGNALTLHNAGENLGATGTTNPMTFAGIETFVACHQGRRRLQRQRHPFLSATGPTITLARWPTSKTPTRWRPRPMMFMVHCDAPGVELRNCPSFSGMGTNTWAVRLTNYFVGEGHIADPVRSFISRIRAAFILLQTGMGLRDARRDRPDVDGRDARWAMSTSFDDRPDDLQAELTT